MVSSFSHEVKKQTWWPDWLALQFVLHHLSDNWGQNLDSDLVYNKQWNAVKRCAPANWKWRQMKEFVLTHDALNLYLEQCYK